MKWELEHGNVRSVLSGETDDVVVDNVSCLGVVFCENKCQIFVRSDARECNVKLAVKKTLMLKVDEHDLGCFALYFVDCGGEREYDWELMTNAFI